MITHNLGYPRIGIKRDLKKLTENYWSGKISKENLHSNAEALSILNWTEQKYAGIDLIPSNDFSFYDHVLDTTLMVGAIPLRFKQLFNTEDSSPFGYPIDAYFSMARGLQKNGFDIHAMEITKWFNTNYHYIVPEFIKEQQFSLSSSKIFNQYKEAKSVGIETKPVLLGPVTFLHLGKEKDAGFHRIELLNRLLPVYSEILGRLAELGVEWVQIDEPCLVTDLDTRYKEAYLKTYKTLREHASGIKLLLTTYFGTLQDNFSLALSLPVDGIHIDLVSGAEQFDEILDQLPAHFSLSLGIVDGRNIWKNDLQKSLEIISKAKEKIGEERLLLAPSCSLLHCPCDLKYEDDNTALPDSIKRWMAFSLQKLDELILLSAIATGKANEHQHNLFKKQQDDIEDRKKSPLTTDPAIRERLKNLTESDIKRTSPYKIRWEKQSARLQLPLLPTTTIGSFPQTPEVRKWRADLKKGRISQPEYENNIKNAIKVAVEWQESIDLDVLVHGEFERKDMVEYFGELLEGFAFTRFGWVQSYGTRYVKPPVIFGDVRRTKPMTVKWFKYAQNLTKKPVKGMLTGPVTMLQWAFVRDDQPRSETCKQIALAIRDEVIDLENAGIGVIQIDEPALREGLPLRRSGWDDFLKWAVQCFRIASCAAKDETQIHTHMCYSEFNDIIESIAEMDADVISIESSRSQMELLDAFIDFKYPNEIGPGIYDIHSPRIPSCDEMVSLLMKTIKVLNAKQLWVNPDCGLKTRKWEEVKPSLQAMVQAAKILRREFDST